MDIIATFAKKFIRNYLQGSITDYDEIIEAAKMKVYEIDNQYDKIKYLNLILEGNNVAYEIHKPSCKNPVDCPTNLAHEAVTYFLAQELSGLGVQLNNDTFTRQEKTSSESKLDQIIEEMEKLKMGQEVIYEDLKKELEELKELYFLGKKKWNQLFLGKCLEMVASGVISETVSKQLIVTFNKTVSGLMNP